MKVLVFGFFILANVILWTLVLRTALKRISKNPKYRSWGDLEKEMKGRGREMPVEGETRLMYNVSDVAEMLRVSTSYMRTMEVEGRILPARRDPRGRRIYTAKEVEVLWRMGVGKRPGELRFASEAMREMGVEHGPEVRI